MGEEIESKVQELFRCEDVALPALVFVRKRADAEAVREALTARFGSRVASAHGGQPKAQRAAAQEAVRSGELDVVACTDAWQAGIDIPNLRAVVLTWGKSAIATQQRLGRGTRLCGPDKPSFQVWNLAGDGLEDARRDRVEASTGETTSQESSRLDGIVIDTVQTQPAERTPPSWEEWIASQLEGWLGFVLLSIVLGVWSLLLDTCIGPLK